MDLSVLERFRRLRVLVVGDAMLDRYVSGRARRLCPEGPVPVVAVEAVREAPGGAANTALNLAQLGATVSFASVVGEADGSSASLVLGQQLAQGGVDTGLMLMAPERTTLTKQRVIANNQLVVRFDQGSTAPLSSRLEDQLVTLIRQQAGQGVDAIVISDYGYGVCTPKVTRAVAQLSEVMVVDSKRLGAYRNLHPTAVKPNYAEAIALLGLPAVPDRRRQIYAQTEALLAATGAAWVVVTLDQDGAIAFRAGQPPHPISAQAAPDGYAIGAGDTFVSALALALAAGATGIEATELASAATAVVVRSPGTTACRLADLQSTLADALIPLSPIPPSTPSPIPPVLE